MSAVTNTQQIHHASMQPVRRYNLYTLHVSVRSIRIVRHIRIILCSVAYP